MILLSQKNNHQAHKNSTNPSERPPSKAPGDEINKRSTTRSASICNKIFWGYALTLGVAILGTSIGLITGYILAEKKQEESLLDHYSGMRIINLQMNILKIRNHQSFLENIVDNPQEFDQQKQDLQKYINQAQKNLEEIVTSPDNTEPERMVTLKIKYDQWVKPYLQKIDQLLTNSNSSILSPEEAAKIQESLLALSRSELIFNVEKFTEELTAMSMVEFEEEIEGEKSVEKAKVLQIKIVGFSMLLSVIIAVSFAFYISRLIALPLQKVTEVVQQVIEESNFNLQVPVKTDDEIAILAHSFNRLILQVHQLLEEQKSTTESQLLQSEKMSSLGRMLAGVAHELNNPINFISGNIVHAKNYVNDLIECLQTYQEEVSHPSAILTEKMEELEVDFLIEDLPKLIESIKIGAERATAIVLSLKDFSRLDEVKPHSVDLHTCLDSTILLLNNRMKKITLVREYGNIPTIEGYTGQLSQVFMNLLSNALDALDEKANTLDSNSLQNYIKEIRLKTERLDQDTVLIIITDNGCGISSEEIEKIFEVFFTTKPRGLGTGLGLAISRQIIIEKHHGQITCESIRGEGTKFTISLPIS